MERKDYLQNPVKHIKINGAQTVDQLMQQFKNSGSLSAGRLATACDIYQKMLKDEGCTIFLALSGAVVPAGMRTLITDLIRKRFIDVIVTTGASMVHDAIEAIGGHHYKGNLAVNDAELYKYHLFRIYDILVPEEDYVKLDFKLSEIYDDIAREHKGESLASNDFSWEIGKRLPDKNSILRAAYEENVPIFMPAIRDSEFGFIHWLHSAQINPKPVLLLDAFKDVPTICGICSKSLKNGMIVIGGGVPRNTIQSSALASKKGLDYGIVITLDRPETGGLSGSTLEETVSWGKMKGEADHVMVIGEALMVFPFLVASVTERLGEGFRRTPLFNFKNPAGKGS
ncbi:MAG TPA: deoxyhypusine synthase family protein [Candidatus Limnocylindrales bacterium]|nr:deoxyhypusine synthase family protein [Candidatus Limnocylindrales bacterium]